ncbi:MAG: hypothetical protein KF724_02585 [Phycisphaeraceae bacterium]|nr:hypothetical protein [Phycisphaeraceae bacterium]
MKSLRLNRGSVSSSAPARLCAAVLAAATPVAAHSDGTDQQSAPPISSSSPAVIEAPSMSDSGSAALPGASTDDRLSENSRDWWIDITPYLWAASVDATIAQKGVSTSFDIPFRDIIKDLDFALMLHLEIGYRRAFFFSDYNYMRLSQTVDVYEPLLTSADVPQLLSQISARDPSFGNGPFASQFTRALVQTEGDLAKTKDLLVQQVDSRIKDAQARIDRVNEALAQFDTNIKQALESLSPEQRKILAQLALNRLDPRVQETLRRINEALQSAETRTEADLRALVGNAYDAAKLNFAEKDQQIQAAIIAGLAALKPGPELNYVEASMTLQIAEFGGGYRLLDWELGRPIGEQHIFAGLDQPMSSMASRVFPVLQFDLIGGARYYNLQYDQTLAFTPDKFGILPAIVSTNSRYEWVDGIIGGRIGLAVNNELRFWCRGDAGGFQSRNNSWCVQGGIQWVPLPWLNVVAGYRALGIQYEENGTQGFRFDGVLQGPVLGVGFSF